MNSSCLELSTSFRLENSRSFSSVARALHLSIKIHAPLAKDGGMSVFNRSKEILFLIDNSISMEGNRLESSKAAIVQLIQTCISEEDLVGIVKFSSSATVEFPLTQIRSLEKKDAVLCAVRKISANGSTNIQAGLITALSQFQTLSPGEIATRQRIIILLSDGEHNHSDPLNIPQISLLATEKSCHGVYCVGIDHGIDLNTLISISTSCKGQFWSSFDGDQFLSELIKSFSKCFAGISTTVCSSLRLAVAGPTGPPALVGRLFHHSMSKSFKLEETKKENTHQTVLSVEIGQIIIDQSIHLSFYFEFLEASEVNDSDSFRLELSYYNHLTNQLEVQTKQVIAPKYLIGLEKGQHRLVQTSVANGEILQSEIISISDEEFQLENTTKDRFFTLFLSPVDKLELHPSSICVIAKVGSLPKRKSSADHETVSEDAIFSCSLLKGTLYANITSYELEVEDVASDSTKLSLKDSRKVLSSQTNGNRVLLLEKTETSHVLCIDGTVEVPNMKGEDEDKSESKCVEITSNKTILKSLEGVVFSRRGGTKEETIKLPLPQNAMLTSEFHQPCHAKDLIDILASPNFREEIDHETEENRKFANRYLSVLSEALEKKDKNECKRVSQNLSDLFERSLSTRFEAAMVAASKSGRESSNSTQDFTPLNLPLLLSYQKVRSSVDSYLKAETKTDSESKRREAEIRVQNLFQTVDQERSMLEGDAEAFLYTTPIQQNIADKVLQSTAVQASSGPSAQMMTILQDQEQLMGRQSVKRGLQAFVSDPVAIQRGGSLLVGAEVSQQRRQECQEQIKSSGETVQDRRSRRESKGPTANTFLESNLVTSGHRVDEVKALASGKVGGLRAMFEKKKD